MKHDLCQLAFKQMAKTFSDLHFFQLLDYQQVKGKSSEFPQINGLFDALLHQRAYIFKAKEATSFKSFKEKMDNIKDSTENDVGPGHPQHHSSV